MSRRRDDDAGRIRAAWAEAAEALARNALPEELRDPGEAFDWTTGVPRARTPERIVREALQSVGLADDGPLPAALQDSPATPASAPAPPASAEGRNGDAPEAGARARNPRKSRRRVRWAAAAAVLLLATTAAGLFVGTERLRFLRPGSAALQGAAQPPDLGAAGIPDHATLADPVLFLRGGEACRMFPVHVAGQPPDLAAFDRRGSVLWTAARDLPAWRVLADPRVRVQDAWSLVVDDGRREKLLVLLRRSKQSMLVVVDPVRAVIDGWTCFTGVAAKGAAPTLPEVVPLGDGSRGILVGGRVGLGEAGRPVSLLLDADGALLQALAYPLLGVGRAGETEVDAVRVDWSARPARVLLRIHDDFLFFETRIAGRALDRTAMTLSFGDRIRAKYDRPNGPGSWEALVERSGGLDALRKRLAASVRPAATEWFHESWSR